jgi:hypothetical protein
MNMSELPFNHAYCANDLGQLYLLKNGNLLTEDFCSRECFLRRRKMWGLSGTQYTILAM